MSIGGGGGYLLDNMSWKTLKDDSFLLVGREEQKKFQLMSSRVLHSLRLKTQEPSRVLLTEELILKRNDLYCTLEEQKPRWPWLCD